MALTSGSKLGTYEILSPLGTGGMGEVYRARDSRLGRDVALKVLPEAVANDAERMSRFEREAQVLASLNHSNIAQIYGLEESGGGRALVMELVEGDDLSAHVAHGPMPLDEALSIARQMAEALEYAHERGVIHRDLKPANIKITPEGIVKVLDFGLAKAVDADPLSSDASSSPTLTAAATRAGVILGTAGYMSPEQARGKGVDRRADIWAFGCVLYEMLTGKPPFGGETATDTLAAVIREEPNREALPANTPVRIRDVLYRCLKKDPKQRLQAIGDARIAIEETMGGGDDPLAAIHEHRPGDDTSSRQFRPRTAAWAAMAILTAVAVLGGWWLRGRHVVQPTHWSGDLLGGSSIAFGPRISPDGHTLAFQAMVDNQIQVAVMNPDSGNWTILTHDRSRGTVQEIAWSPDGSKLYFDRVSGQPMGIYSVPSLGGEERLVLKDAASPEALADGSLLVWRIDSERKNRIYHFWPDSERLQPLQGWIPPTLPVALMRVFADGKEAVFFGMTEGMGAGESPHLYALDLASGKARRLAAQLPIRQMSEGFPLAPTPDNRSVLIDLPAGNLHQVVAIPRSGSGAVQVLMTLTIPPWTMDAGPDGSIYVDQVDRSIQILRFTPSGGVPEVLATAEVRGTDLSSPVEFPDGRFLLSTLLAGRSQLLIGKPGGNFFPLVDTTEETRLPAALLPENQVAFIAGTGSDQTIAIASAGDGRIIRRLQGCKGEYVTGLSASPEGKTLYYATGGSIWAIPAADGTSRKISAGDGVTADPNGKDLIVNLVERGGVRLVRVPLSGGTPQDIQVQSDVAIDPLPLGGGGLRSDGKLLVGVVPRDSWFFRTAVLDLANGKLTRVPLNFTGDTLMYGWTNDGRILAWGEPMQAHIWRFRPIH
jgi:hypothetical protein